MNLFDSLSDAFFSFFSSDSDSFSSSSISENPSPFNDMGVGASEWITPASTSETFSSDWNSDFC